jgi:NTE family protein
LSVAWGRWLAAWAALWLLLCPPMVARADPTTPGARPRVALVLSGGGARGFAHVGVLQALERARVPVDLVVGTSMGAIVGGLYAAGLDATELEQVIRRVDWNTVFDDRGPRPGQPHRLKEEDFEFSPVLQLGFRNGEFRLPQGTLSTRSLELLLREHTLHTRHANRFDELPTPFRAVATDMESGAAAVLERGDLAAALRASMSVPGAFSPLEWNARILGDGGLVDNLPVGVARALGVDAVIAVNIGTPLASRDALGSVIGVTVQMINILTEQNVQRSIASLGPQDLLLAPPLGTIASTEFGRAPELIELGRTYAAAQSDALTRYAVGQAEYEAWRRQRRDVRQAMTELNPGRLAFVRLDGVDYERQALLRRRIESRGGEAMDPAKVQRDIQRLADTQDYQRLDYQLERGDDGAEGLVYALEDNAGGRHRFRIGLGLRTDFNGQAEFDLRVSHTRRWLNDLGAEWRNQLQLGSAPALRSEVYQPLDLEDFRFASAYAEAELRRIELFDAAGDPQAQYRRQTSRLGLDLGWHLGRDGSWGDLRLGWVGAVRRSLPDYIAGVPPSQIQDQRWNERAWRLAVVTDQLDHANFPQSGHRFKLDVQTGRFSDSSGEVPFTRWDGSINGVTTFGAHTLNAQLRMASSSHVAPGAVDEYSLGGFQQLSGYRVGQVAGDQLILGRLAYYRRLTLQPGVARAWFGGATLELGNAWDRRADMSWRDLRLGSSLFLGADTAMGPAYLALVRAPRGYTGIYFLFGRP